MQHDGVVLHILVTGSPGGTAPPGQRSAAGRTTPTEKRPGRQWSTLEYFGSYASGEQCIEIEIAECDADGILDARQRVGGDIRQDLVLVLVDDLGDILVSNVRLANGNAPKRTTIGPSTVFSCSATFSAFCSAS